MGAMEEMSRKGTHPWFSVLIDVAASERDSTSINGNTATLHIHLKVSGTVLEGSSMGAMEEMSWKGKREALTSHCTKANRSL